jgi:hypothetical protein
MLSNNAKDKKKMHERKMYSLKKGPLNSSFYREDINEELDDEEEYI